MSSKARLLFVVNGLAAGALLLAACGPNNNSSDAAPDASVDANPPVDAPPATRALTLLYTNDEHSHLFAFGPEIDDFPVATAAGTGVLKGGVARRKVVLDRERAAARTAGADVLTLSAGDNSQGTLTQAAFTTLAPDYTVLKQLGYDVTTLGNHEFDYGPSTLALSITTALGAGGLPQIVASNLHFSDSDPADDTLAAQFGEGTSAKPIKRYHVITTPGGIKVGVFGILGAEAAYFAPFKAPVRASGLPAEETNYAVVLPKIYADIQPIVDALRSTEKVDIVIALSHSGLDLNKPGMGEDELIAANVHGLDVIISGHSHTVVNKPIVIANSTDQRPVLIVQAGSFGRYVGRLPLTLTPNDKAGATAPFNVTFDSTAAQLLPVDDTQIPDPALATFIGTVVKQLEGTHLTNGSSFLEGALSRITGTSIVDDASRPGSLYFYPIGTTTFDILSSTNPVETNIHNLDGDAMYSAAAAALPDAPDVAIPASGVIRADLQKGKTGSIAFADTFRTFPLGFSPADGTIGYPIIHAYLFLVEVKAAYEIGASLGLAQSDFFLGASGMRVTVDTTRPAFDAKSPTDPQNGRVTKIEYDSQHRVGQELYDTVLFDITRAAPWQTGNYNYLSLVHVVTDLYIASFAASQGVTLKTSMGTPLKLTDAIVHRQDGSEVKEYEAFAAYIQAQSTANGGALPSRYDATTPQGKVPRRILCSGPLCGKN